jgi:hypothetical protein
LLGLIFDLEVGGSKFLRNVGNYRILSRYDPEGNTLHKLMIGNKVDFRGKCLADDVISLFANVIFTF